jgi:quinol monooxygenase YgiN
MSLTVHLELQFTPESVALAPAMLREILADTRVFEGCLGVNVLVDRENPEHVILAQTWASVEADAAYRDWRAGGGATQLGTLLAAAPVLTRFETATDI